MIEKYVPICAMLALTLVPHDSAWGTTVYSDTVLVSGSETLSVFELRLDAPGDYRVTATDLGWLNTTLQALSFGVFTSTQSIATRAGPGTIEFFHAGTGPVYLQLYARTLASSPAGLIGVNAATVVALPSSLLLLASALFAAALPRLRRWLSTLRARAQRAPVTEPLRPCAA
jgi:hypothetical protein